MKISDIINYPLRVFGVKLARITSLKKLQAASEVSDIESDNEFMTHYEKVKNYTMVSMERCYALYNSVKYILKNNIPGDFVECGVWKGGSCMLIADILLKSGVNNRNIYLYDSFEGMPKPGEQDGEFEKLEWEKQRKDNGDSNWIAVSLDEVKLNLKKINYPESQLHYIKGLVEETIPGQIPQSIALLRLDTDWYSSTIHELKHLYPLLTKSGVLIIDDYGKWQGARKAVKEYFGENNVFLNRIDNTGRLLVK